VQQIINQNTNSNKRQSDSSDLDDQDQPRIIKTVPGSQRIATTVNSGPGLICHRLNFVFEI
jgi:hypothetical protein